MDYNEEQTQNAQFIYDFFIERDWSTQAIAGMLGNMAIESFLYPDIWEGGTEPGTGTGPGYGLVQWTEATKLTDWAEQNGLDPADIETQCLRLQYEFDNNIQYVPRDSYPMTAEEYVTSTESARYLAEVFLFNYEQPGELNEPQRLDEAEYWYDYFTNGNPPDDGDDEDEDETPATFLIVLGHGPDSDGNYDSGAIGIDGESEAGWLRGPFLTSMKDYAEGSSIDIDFYEENFYANREAETIEGYDVIVELHLDSAVDSSKNGGHLIIYEQDDPDSLDEAFRDLVNKHFGIREDYQNTDGFSYRGENSVEDNVYNVSELYRRGITNSFLELCFITSTENMDYFKENYDEVAADLIGVISGSDIDPGPDPDPDPDPDPGESSISDIQEWLNSNYNAGLDVDGSFGPATNEAVVRAVQTELNAQHNAGLDIDGSFGPATQLAWVPLVGGETGNLVYLAQAQTIGAGYDPQGFDGSYGPSMQAAVRQFQSDQGLAVDGFVGPATSYALFNHTKGWHWGWIPNPNVTVVQQWLNTTYGSGIEVDGSYGPLARTAAVRAVQTEMNEQYNAGLEIDGSFGPASQAAWQPLTQGVTGNITQLVQGHLIGIGYDPQGFDGSFGPGMESAVRQFQTNQGLAVDGSVGPATASTLFNL